jgi:hypothetical protein
LSSASGGKVIKKIHPKAVSTWTNAITGYGREKFGIKKKYSLKLKIIKIM